jgi:hypothetical protein
MVLAYMKVTTKYNPWQEWSLSESDDADMSTNVQAIQGTH